MSSQGHPYSLGAHPWNDPLGPQDLIAGPPPLAELSFAGALAPQPSDFPFTPEGRRDYYASVRSAAHQQMAMQQHAAHMQSIQAHEASVTAGAAATAAAQERAAFVLLLAP